MKNVIGKKVSVIMPAYNEGEHIKASIDETIRTFAEFKCDFELIVLDDGSSDDTYKQAVTVARDYDRNKIIIKRNFDNFGKGRALKKAFRYVQGDYVIFIDADMDLHPGQIATFFDIMELTDTDIVIGSKQHPNSQLNYPWHRRIISMCYYLIIKIMFGLPVHDTQTGLKLFKVEVLRSVLPVIVIKEFAFDLEILALAHRKGFKIAEAPVILDSRRILGRIGLKAIWKTLLDTIAIFYRMHILKFYDRASSKTINKQKHNGLQKKKRPLKRISSIVNLFVW